MNRIVYGMLGTALALTVGVFASNAQATAAVTTPDPQGKRVSDTLEIFYLKNINQHDDLVELYDTTRMLVPANANVRIVASQNALVVHAPAEDMVVVRKIIADLDRPKKTYRIIYTITESDQGKRIGTQHFSMVVVSGQRTTLKEGSKVPVSTGSYSSGNSTTQSQFTYLDVGINLDATVDESAVGVRLRSKEEQSSIAESAVGPQDPIVRQSVLEGTSIITLGKPLILGSLDVPGSTRHLDIEAVVEVVK